VSVESRWRCVWVLTGRGCVWALCMAVGVVCGYGSEESVMPRVSVECSADVAELVERVLDRGDAADALDYISSVPEGGPSCGCGGNHWSCDYDAGEEDADEVVWGGRSFMA